MPPRTYKLLPTLGIFFAPDKGAPEGGSPKLTLEQQLAAAQSDLAKANESLSAVTGERDKAMESVKSITAERDNLQSQFDSATTTAESLRKDLDAANATISTITGERDAARTDLAAATTNVSRLEKLCSLKGIDPKNAIAPENAPDAPKSEADYRAALSAAKTDAERDKVLAEFSAAAKAGKLV